VDARQWPFLVNGDGNEMHLQLDFLAIHSRCQIISPGLAQRGAPALRGHKGHMTEEVCAPNHLRSPRISPMPHAKIIQPPPAREILSIQLPGEEGVGAMIFNN
jgi:hypothetical protein